MSYSQEHKLDEIKINLTFHDKIIIWAIISTWKTCKKNYVINLYET